MSSLRHEAATIAQAPMKSGTPRESSFHRLSDEFDAVLHQEWRLGAWCVDAIVPRSHLHLKHAETLSRGPAEGC